MRTIVVTTLADDGAGSLRAALAAAAANSEPVTVRFAQDLSGGVVGLLSPLTVETGTVTIDGDIDGDTLPDIVISGGAAFTTFGRVDRVGVRHFEIGAAATVELASMQLENGGDLARSGDTQPAVGSIVNEGRLSIRDSSIFFLLAVSETSGTDIVTQASASIHNRAGGQMTIANTIIGRLYSEVGRTGGALSDDVEQAEPAVAGILNDGVLTLDKVSVEGTANGAFASSEGVRAADAVIGVLNRGEIRGPAEGDEPLFAARTSSSSIAGRGPLPGELLIGAVDADGGKGADRVVGFIAATYTNAIGQFLSDPASRLLLGFARRDDISGIGGDATIMAGAGDDLVRPSLGDQLIFGEDGDDELIGGPGMDTIHGGVGDDTIFTGQDGRYALSGGGDGVALGGAGDDMFGFAALGYATIDGGDGVDKVVFITTTFEPEVTSARFDFSETGPQTVTPGLVLTARDVEQVIGTEGDDRFFGSRGAETMEGGNGDDLLAGGGGADRLFADGGQDRIEAGAGSDVAFGGAGDDTIAGQGARDRLLGGAGADAIFGGAGGDTIRGSGGADTILGQGGSDRLSGGGKADVIDGGVGRDTIDGGPGRDTIFGGAGADFLSGGGGVDFLVFEARSGADTVEKFQDGMTRLVFLTENSQVGAFDDLTITQAGRDVLIAFRGGSILLLDERAGAITEADFLFL